MHFYHQKRRYELRIDGCIYKGKKFICRFDANKKYRSGFIQAAAKEALEKAEISESVFLWLKDSDLELDTALRSAKNADDQSGL
jgi:hypothetical protein